MVGKHELALNQRPYRAASCRRYDMGDEDVWVTPLSGRGLVISLQRRHLSFLSWLKLQRAKNGDVVDCLVRTGIKL